MTLGVGMGLRLTAPLARNRIADDGGETPPSGEQARYLRFIALAPYWTDNFTDGWLIDEAEVFVVGESAPISLGKTVVAGTGCTGTVANATNGIRPNKSQATSGPFMAEPASGKYFTVDLGEVVSDIRAIDVWVDDQLPNHDFEVWASDDNVSYSKIGEFDAVAGGSGTGRPSTIEFAPEPTIPTLTGRYVRFTATDKSHTTGFSDGWVVDEVSILDTDKVNVAKGALVTPGPGHSGSAPSLTTDEVLQNQASGGVGIFFTEPADGDYFTVDLGSVMELREFRLWSVDLEPQYQFTVEVSSDGVAWSAPLLSSDPTGVGMPRPEVVIPT